MNDPIVAEVRKHRDEHARQFGYDIVKICKDYRQKHSLYVERLREMKKNANTKAQATLGSHA